MHPKTIQPIADLLAFDDVQFEDSDAPIYIGPPESYSNRIARLLTMKRSQVLPDRTSWSNMTITMVSGCCQVELEDEVWELKKHAHLNIPANVSHRIQALTDLRAVITFEPVD